MNTKSKSRASELAEAIAYQELLLDLGAKRLRELNDEYDLLDREYKLLLSKKRTLTEEVIILTTNLDFYSNL